MATQPISLTAHRNTAIKRDRRRIRDRAREMAREVPADADGVALVWFRRNNAGSVAVSAHYSLRDPMDGYHLPEMARAEIKRVIDGE